MTKIWHDYRGYRINIREVPETTEERLVRDDCQSKVISKSFQLYESLEEGLSRKVNYKSEEYSTEEKALDMAQRTVDAILRGHCSDEEWENEEEDEDAEHCKNSKVA